MPLPTKPPLSPKHTEERLKYAATGLQTFAFTLFVGVLIGPAINPNLVAPLLLRAAAIVVAGLAVLLGFILLRYIQVPDPKEPSHG